MREIDDLSAAHDRLADTTRRMELCEAANDRIGWMDASEEVWAAEAEVARAAEQLGLTFALLLRCALDHPTATVQGLATALAPVADQALAGQVEWLRRKVNEQERELEKQAEAIARLEAQRHDAAIHTPDRPGRDHGNGTTGATGAGAGGSGRAAGAAGPAAGREGG